MWHRAKTLRPVAFSFTGTTPALLLGLWEEPYTYSYPIDLPPTQQSDAMSELAGRWNTYEARVGAAIYDKIIDGGWERSRSWSKPQTDSEVAMTEASLKKELTLRRVAWQCAVDEVYDGERRVLRDVYLDWGAKVVIMLGAEWEQRKAGAEEYLALRKAGKLPWQDMIKKMTAGLGGR